MFINRKITSKLQDGIRYFPAVVVTGARQIGKTTLIKKLLPNYSYVTLDRPLAAEQAEVDPEAFLKAYPAPVIIDEIQYAPSLFRYLKIKIDENRDLKGQYILAGSQKFTLMKGVSESLAGRAAIIELEGLSCMELLDENIIGDSLEAYESLIVRGGFPELWTDLARPTNLFFDSYIATYLERDVRQILAVGNLRDFERFLRAASLKTAQQLNKSVLAREVGVSVTTIGQWLSVLEALGHVVLLEPWFANLKKRLVKSPKIYFSDTSLVCALLGIDRSNLSKSSMVGALWETFVFAELRKQLAFKGEKQNLWYYRDQSQNEVDFIWEKGSELHLIECKWTNSPNASMAKNLDKVAGIFAKNSAGMYEVMEKSLVTRAEEHFRSNGLTYRSPYSLLT